jgi:Flp pilus assembly protein TadD
MTSKCRIAAAALLIAYSPAAFADASDPAPPAAVARDPAAAAYNEGVKLMVDGRYAEAQRSFEAALARREAFAEAHNNLAFVIRMQGAAGFNESLRHYARALELDPKLARAYMYRGVLYTQMGDAARAQADLATLRGLDRQLAAKLEKAIAAGGREGADAMAGAADRIY